MASSPAAWPRRSKRRAWRRSEHRGSGEAVPGFDRVCKCCLGDALAPILAAERFDAVVHAALDTGPNAYTVNVAGTQRWMEEAAAAGIGLQILLSTLSATPDARSDYGQAKYDLERDLPVGGRSRLSDGDRGGRGRDVRAHGRVGAALPGRAAAERRSPARLCPGDRLRLRRAARLHRGGRRWAPWPRLEHPAAAALSAAPGDRGDLPGPRLSPPIAPHPGPASADSGPPRRAAAVTETADQQQQRPGANPTGPADSLGLPQVRIPGSKPRCPDRRNHSSRS